MRRERRGENCRVLIKEVKKKKRLDVFQSIPVLRIRNIPTNMVFCVIFSQRHEASGCGVQGANTLIQSSDLTGGALRQLWFQSTALFEHDSVKYSEKFALAILSFLCKR